MSIAISQDKHCFVKGVAHIVECVWVCRWVVLQEDARDCCEVKVGFRVRLRGRGWDSHFAGWVSRNEAPNEQTTGRSSRVQASARIRALNTVSISISGILKLLVEFLAGEGERGPCWRSGAFRPS
jgi:hypothetical protein